MVSRFIPLCALLLSGTALAQSVPVFTGPSGTAAATGDPIKQAEVKGAFGSKQDVTGALSLLSYAPYGTRACSGGDDTSAFNAAIAAATAAGGGTVVVPAGTCRTSAMITLPRSVRLVGQGERSLITPTASMAAVIQVVAGQSAIEHIALQASGTLAPVGIRISKPVADTFPVNLVRLTVLGFAKGVQYVTGDTVIVTGGLYLNNTIAFSFNPTVSSITTFVIQGGTMVQGGSGIDLGVNLANSPYYAHVEGLLVNDLQVFMGVENAYCMRIAAGVHITWRGGMCTEARAGGYGFRLVGTADAIRSVDIGNVFVGANPTATGTVHGVSIEAPATAVKLHGMHFSSWVGTPIAVDNGGTGTAKVSISMPSFDGTLSTNDITVSHAVVTITQPQYDVSVGALAGTGGTIASWP